MIDLNNLSAQDVQALAQAKRLGNGKFVAVMERIADDTKTQLVHADDMVRIHRLQGRVEMLEALVAAFDQAAELQ
jgi:hypothetical protein